MHQGTTTDGTHWKRSGRQDRPTVVLIHGLGLTMSTWDPHLAAFEAAYDVIRYDLIGHGQSGPPPDGLTLRHFGDQVVALMDALRVNRAHLVGFSLGGMINRRIAIDHPERVRSLVILNSPHERGPEAQRLVEERALASAAGGPGATIDATLERWFTESFRADHPMTVAAVRDTVLANDLVYYAAARWVLANGVTELIRPSPALHHPTLVMTCEHDSGSTPAMSHAIASEIVGADVEIVDRLQHLGLLEDPARFTTPTLAFLERTDLV